MLFDEGQNTDDLIEGNVARAIDALFHKKGRKQENTYRSIQGRALGDGEDTYAAMQGLKWQNRKDAIRACQQDYRCGAYTSEAKTLFPKTQ